MVAIPHEANPGRRQRQVSDGGGQQELEERLGPIEAARLARAELHKPRQPVLGHLAKFAIRCERLASLEGSRLLEQGLLWVDHHQPTLPEARSHA